MGVLSTPRKCNPLIWTIYVIYEYYYFTFNLLQSKISNIKQRLVAKGCKGGEKDKSGTGGDVSWSQNRAILQV